MYETSKAAHVANEMRHYNIVVLGICKSRWNGAGRITLATGEQLVYSGLDNEQHTHTEGVAFMMSKLATKALIEWVPVSPRIITARFNSKDRKVTLINCYAPANNTTDELKQEFFDSLQRVLDHTPRRDIRILMGDLNAKIGSDNTGKERIMGRHGLRCLNENGERLADLYAFNDLVIGGSIYPHKTTHKATWISPDGRSSNQIDHIAIGRKWRRSLIDVRVKRGADVASDHHLLLGVIKVKLRAKQDHTCTPHYKYNTQNLKSKEIAETFSCSVKNRYSALEFVEEDVDSHWTALKHTWQKSCDEVLGKRRKSQKEWLSAETWNLITQRKRLKVDINSCSGQAKKSNLTSRYWQLNKDVRKSAKKDKKAFLDTLATEVESAAGQRNMKRLYDITRAMSGKRSRPPEPVKNKDGIIITEEQDQRAR